VCFRVKRHSLRPRQNFHGCNGTILVRSIFMDHRNGSVAVRIKYEPHLGIGSKAVASMLSPRGKVVITRPVSAFMTAITRLLHPINKRRFVRSMAMLPSDVQGAIFHRCSTVNWRASILTTRLSALILQIVKNVSCTVRRGELGATTQIDRTTPLSRQPAPITVVLLLSPLKANTRRVTES
jgi:hypothetical protein